MINEEDNCEIRIVCLILLIYMTTFTMIGGISEIIVSSEDSYSHLFEEGADNVDLSPDQSILVSIWAVKQ